MNEEYKTYVNMKGDLVKTNVKIVSPMPVKINGKVVIFSLIIILLYVFYYIFNDFSFLSFTTGDSVFEAFFREVIPMSLGIILFYFAFEFSSYINKNAYFIPLVLFYALIGLIESFRAFLFLIASILSLFG